MRKTITVTKTDAIDQVFPLTGGRTEIFSLPPLTGGAFVRVYDTPVRGTACRCGVDYHLQDAGSRDGRVRIVAIPGGLLKDAASVYVVTAGNTWQEEATVEVYGEEERDG